MNAITPYEEVTIQTLTQGMCLDERGLITEHLDTLTPLQRGTTLRNVERFRTPEMGSSQRFIMLETVMNLITDNRDVDTITDLALRIIREDMDAQGRLWIFFEISKLNPLQAADIINCACEILTPEMDASHRIGDIQFLALVRLDLRADYVARERDKRGLEGISYILK